MKLLMVVCVLAFLPFLQGCNSSDAQSKETAQLKVVGETVLMPTNCPQSAALTIEPVGSDQPVMVPLTGRLVWNDDATVRVFTPFAGIVRRLLVEVNQPVTNGMALAEIQSGDFGQAQAEARKAGSDFRRADRNLTRLRE